MSIKLTSLALVALLAAGCNQHGQLLQEIKTNTPLPPVEPAPPVSGVEDDQGDLLAANAMGLVKHGIRLTHLGPNINTANTDASPFRYADRLYFTTLSTYRNGLPPVNQIYSSLNGTAPVPWSENSKEAKTHTSNMTISADGQRAYFTMCKEETPGVQTCEIFTRERTYEGAWLPFKRLPRTINLSGYTATQPSIGYDHFLKKEVLFFSSNRPGGMGGMDIWCSAIDAEGNYGAPFSLPFNSPQDDVTPFFYQAGQALFFSSNRLGEQSGLDIFRASKTIGGGAWSAPERLDQPFNSQYDELYFSCHSASGRSYLASNRPGCLAQDLFEGPMPVELDVQVASAATDTKLEGTSVLLTDVATGIPVSPKGEADRNFNILPGKTYNLTVEAAGFVTEHLTVDASASDAFSKVEKLVRLRQKAKLVVETFSSLDSLPIGGVEFRFETPGAESPVLHKSEERTTADSFLVAFGEKSKLEATKPGYKPAVLNFEAPDDGPSMIIYQQVYLQPFAGLPLALYFDNDQPRWEDPQDRESKLNYEQTLEQYLERKPIFVEKYGEGLAQEAYEAARAQVLAFFENEVEANFGQFNELCNQLEYYLNKGCRLEILTEGEASLLASADYNKRLIARRVSTLRNYLKSWHNGALENYVSSGKLVVYSSFKKREKTPTAGTAAPVPPLDRRQAEFSPEASRLRKVVIKDVRIQVPKA